jgi:hypothetical protein
MSDQSNDNGQQKLAGELFTRLYMDRRAPLQDSQFFRTRLEAYFEANHFDDYAWVAAYMKQEAGYVIPSMRGSESILYKFDDFFSAGPIEQVLSSLTLIWRYYSTRQRQTTVYGDGRTTVQTPKADAWLAFVRRALHEEHMAYTVDNECGAHFVVDEEFERNRVSALRCLDASRYSGARAAFESAHSYLDAPPGDTKASVRSAFEALEIVARLIDPTSRNLNKWMVENKLMPLAQGLAQDDIEKGTIASLFEGIGRFVDGLHNYRHGQGAEQLIAPSLPVTVYVLSSVASALRWLVLIDSQTKMQNS